MYLLPPHRPLLNLSYCRLQLSIPLHLVPRRHESSARRSTKRLQPTRDKAAIPTTRPPHDHIVFNPPSSAPSPYHTPPAFLPPGDSRRAILAQAHAHANPYVDPERPLPPPVHKPYEKKYHLTQQEINEIRRLRADDPWKWTRAVLAEKYGCTKFFVGIVAQASQERMAWSKRLSEQTKERWGKRRTYAREERTKRREMWARDE